ncbi:MAG TPA: hypothetical protein VF278_03710, partial [Pirellulales bacterium]
MSASPNGLVGGTLCLPASLAPRQRTTRSVKAATYIAAVAMFLVVASAKAESDAKPAALPVATLAQFDQAMELAVLATEHDLHELSLRAVRDALRPGPPALPMKAMRRVAAGIIRSSSANQPDADQSQIAQRVEQRLSLLNALWKSRSAPPKAVYEALVSAVLPAGRPGEIMLYAPPLTVNSLANPASAGKMLVDWAVRADCADQLRQEIAGRLEQPLAQLPGHVLLAQLALAAGDRQAAGESLAWLNRRLSGETLQNSAQIACHAALPALNDKELATKAVSIVELAAKNLSAQVNQSSNDEPVASLLLLLARHQLRHGAAAAGRKSLDDYLAVCQQMNVRYVGDYGIYRRKQQLAKVAAELAVAGQLDPALDMLGQVADTQLTSRYGQANTSASLVPLLRKLAATPAAERYEKLKKWSLPTKDRKSIRLLAAFVPQDDLPEVFRQGGWASRPVTSTGDGPGGPSSGKGDAPARQFSNSSGDLISTLGLLVAGARAAGQLDELAKIAAEAAHDPNQKIENATVLQILVELARCTPENARQAATDLAAELAKSTPAQAWTLSGLPDANYLLANACAADAALNDVGFGMLTTLVHQSQQSQNHPLLAHLRGDLGQQVARRLGRRRRDDIGQRVPWHPAVFMSAATHQAGPARPWWSVDGRQVVFVGGAEMDHLVFDYPLTGTFEVTADLLDGNWSEASVGYGGLCFAGFTHSKTSHIFPVGRHEQIVRPLYGRSGELFRRYSVQVSPDGVRFSIDGQQVYRDTSPSSAAP